MKYVKALLALALICLFMIILALRYLGFNNYSWDMRLIADDDFNGVLLNRDKYSGAAGPGKTYPRKIFTRSDIRQLLADRVSDEFNETAIIYLLTPDGDPSKADLALELKKRLLDEADRGNYTGPANGVKYIQFVAMTRALMFLMLKENEGLFTEAESIRIVDWFSRVVERTFTVEWVDYLYAWKFRIEPQGPYVNQEMGAGALVVFAEVIKERYPELWRKCLDYVDENSVFWKGNFRNTDDSLIYQKVWIYGAYLMSFFRPREELQKSENARKSFDWLCLQWPATGVSPAYNELNPISVPDVLSLGAHLFNDGRYKWIANRILNHMEENDLGFTHEPTFLYGFSFWNDSLPCVVPDWGSVYFVGPGNLPIDPGPMNPDKIVLRDGWDDSSLYLLLNLRYTGWYGYKATNAVINVICGEPFVGEDYILQGNKLLSLGRKADRDGRIDRTRLNGLQIARPSFVRSAGELLKIWSPWEQDLPKYALVEYLKEQDRMDVSKSLITDWHGWQHTRLCALIKNRFIAVIDNASGSRSKDAAITWHLKGNAIKAGHDIFLSQNGYRMQVSLPHHTEWYETKIFNGAEKARPAGDVHDMDLDVFLVSEGKHEFSTVSLFIPGSGPDIDEQCQVTIVDVTREDDSPAYPDAVCVSAEDPDHSWSLGARFEEMTFDYGDLSSDAELFYVDRDELSWDISYISCRELFIRSDKDVRSITALIDGMWEQVSWQKREGGYELALPASSGLIRVQFEGSQN